MLTEAYGTTQVQSLDSTKIRDLPHTATLQNYDLKHIIAIDELRYDFKIYDEIAYTDVFLQNPSSRQLMAKGVSWYHRQSIFLIAQKRLQSFVDQF